MEITMEITVLIPVYNEEKNVNILYNEILDILKNLRKDFEIIFIDDGSKDNTLKNLHKIREIDNMHVRLIHFNKNFGKANALSIGFKNSRGNIVITLDGDLQDDPKEIPRFIEEIEKGYDFVNGWKFDRKDPFEKRIFSKFFNFLVRRLTRINIHDSNCGFKAYRHEVIEKLTIYAELHRYIPSLVSWMGFSMSEIKVNHRPRLYGSTKYGISRLWIGFLDLILVQYLLRYSGNPFHFFGNLGLISIFTGSLIGIYLAYLNLIYNVIILRPSLFLAVLLIIIGVQFLFLGLIAEMIVNITKENKIHYEVFDE